jgi:hypothetical protein
MLNVCKRLSIKNRGSCLLLGGDGLLTSTVAKGPILLTSGADSIITGVTAKDQLPLDEQQQADITLEFAIR